MSSETVCDDTDSDKDTVWDTVWEDSRDVSSMSSSMFLLLLTENDGFFFRPQIRSFFFQNRPFFYSECV